MEANLEGPLVEALIKLLLSAEGTSRDGLFKSLVRLSSFEKILEYIMKVFCKCETIAFKRSMAHLYFEYVKAKSDLITGVSSALLFEHFKHLVCEVPPLETDVECTLMREVLEVLVQSLSTFSATALLSAVASWGSQHSLVALYAISTVHETAIGKFFSQLLTEMNGNIETMTIAYEFLIRHNIGALEEGLAELVHQMKFTESITKVFRECSRSQNHMMRIGGFRLIGGAFHFLENRDALVFCLNISEDIIQGIRIANKQVTVTALDALCELPLSSDSSVFDPENQITTFVPLFANYVRNFDDDIADAVIRFVDPRKEACDLTQWLIGMLQKDTDSARVTVLLACRYQMVSVVQDYVFPSEYDSPSVAGAACAAIAYLASNNSLTPELIPKALRTVMVAMSIDDDMVSLLIPVALQEILNSSAEVPSVLFNAVVVNLNLVQNDGSLLLLASALFQYCSKHEQFEVTPCDPKVFATRVYQILVVYINTPKTSKSMQSLLLFLLRVLHATVVGSFVAGEPLDGLSIAGICENVIPSEYVNLVHEQALLCFEKEPAASVICVSLKNTKRANPMAIFEKIKDAEPVNELIFQHFFHSAATINRSGAITMFAQIVAELNEESKSKPVFSSLFKILSGEAKPKYSRDLILSTIACLVSEELTYNQISELFFALDYVLRQDSESLEVLLMLVKLHIPGQMPPTLLAKILSQPYFVSAIPHIMVVVKLPLHLFNACFDQVFRSGDVSLYAAFCENCQNITEFEVFDASVSALLDQSNSKKFVLFSQQVCEQLSHNKTSPRKLELMTRLVDHILYEQEDVRTSAKKAICALLSIEKDVIVDGNLPYGEIVKQAQVMCKEWSAKITGYEALDIASIIVKTNPLTLPHALFLWEISKTQKRIISGTEGLIEFLISSGEQVDVRMKRVLKGLINNIADSDFGKLFNTFLKIQLNDFAKELIGDFIGSTTYGKQILDQFFDYFIDYRLTTDDSVLCGRYQLAALICHYNRDRDIDFRLFWILLAKYTLFLDPKQKISRGVLGASLTAFNESLCEVLNRLGIDHVDISSWRSCSDIIDYFHGYTRKMSLADIESLIDARQFIPLRRVAGVFTVSSFGILMAQILLDIKTNQSLSAKAAKEVSTIVMSGKDDSAKLITARFASLFDSTDFHLFDTEDIKRLLDAARRSLIRPSKDIQTDNIAFLKKVLAAAPPELIKESKRVLLETLRTAFDFCTVEDLLDAMKDVMSCDDQLSQVTNMAQISLPRIITLSVNEKQSIREKATSILLLLSQAQNEQSIVEGFVKLLGLQEVATISHIFVDWLSRSGLNSYSMDLLLKFTNVLLADKQLKTDFAKKVAPLLKPVMTDIKNPLQSQALDIMSTLLA